MRIRTWITVGAVTLGLATAAWAITGKNGWTAMTVTTAAAVKANSTYVSGFAGTPWQDLAAFELLAPNTNSQRDGLAADGSGNLYVLVRGAARFSSGPQYTGLVRVSGSTITTLLQDAMSSSVLLDRTGAELDAVVVSPSDAGTLTRGHPVVRRWVDETAGGNSRFPGHLDVVSVDPSSGAETFIYRFANLSHLPGALAIDGSATATNGTIYVDNQDGSIARLTYSGGAWIRDTVPGSIVSGTGGDGLRVGPDGMLYTSSSGWGVILNKNPNHPIHRMDPATGASSLWGYVEGTSRIQSWDFDASGTLWFGLSSTSSKYAKSPAYVTRGVAGGVTNINNRIAESANIPWCVTGAAGAVYVLENLDTIYALR
jgi:hypothetical protein